jgi:FkbH-like protein
LRLRQEIDHLIANGDFVSAARRLAELWELERGSATASFVTSRYEKLRAARQFIPHRLAVLRSFTLEPVVPLLRAAAFVAGIDLAVQLGDFNAYAQEILDDQSSLYAFAPDTVILAVQTRDIAPELWAGYADLSADAVSSAVARVVDSFRSWISAFRQNSRAHLILHTFERPPIPNLGVLDAQSEPSQSNAIRQINDSLKAVCREHRGVFLLDYGALIARHGYALWHDEKKWLTARMPITASHLTYLAQEWLRFLIPLNGRTAKALIVDLDNTLWGGIVGEDGMDGIRLGPEYPGAAHQALQRALLDLHRKGILLAICSKNNYDDAMEALSQHPGMLLKPEHFAAIRINWNDKALNVREIAAELNIGIDSLAFLDDYPVERAQMRIALPEVTVIELPSDPSLYADAVRDCPGFERLTISEEDRQRTALYAAERERSRAEQSFTSKEDFYRSLEQEAEIAAVDSSTLARVAQLTQKTNQFNLTTRRYSEEQIKEIAARPGWQVTSLRVRDRYGDHGLVGVAITHDQAEVREIDSFLLSCRVIGRDVETALLSHLAQTARAGGMKSMRGWFVPTKKNAPAKEFYAQHGFTVATNNGDGSLWALDLQSADIECPEWVKVRIVRRQPTKNERGEMI